MGRTLTRLNYYLEDFVGTRGAWGFVIDGKEKITYNHFDSYPDGLGFDVLKWLRAALHDDELLAKVRSLRVIPDPQATPSDEDFERLANYHDPHVSTGRDWYSLLRHTQGNPALVFESGHMLDGHDFPLDSLFCEYAYVVDLDRSEFQAYTGFVSEPHSDGRWASMEASRSGSVGPYYPCRLVKAWPFDRLPSEDELVAAYSTEDDDED